MQNVITQARAALENPRLTGEPVMRQGNAGSTGQDSMPSPSAGFDMGQVSSLLCLLLPAQADNEACLLADPCLPSLSRSSAQQEHEVKLHAVCV